ncbi:MAG: FAD-binding oxidoreductase [Nitrosopumilales archaeon]|nr:MAG: FAD-binding oxidoreductase [Nitrosopumilales archaeon]
MKAEKIGAEIQRITHCQVLWDKYSRDFYSVDASSYLVKPLVVVFPRNENEIIKILRFASKKNIPVTPRGAGTGLVGSALGSGIILDLKNFDKIRIHPNYVQADSGVLKGILDKKLEEGDKFFGPDPSVGPYCTIGGMIATNASGSHSLKYGSVIDNLIGVRIITSSGKAINLPSKSQFGNKILKMINRSIQEKFPHVSKNSCGYRLDKITKKTDLQKIIAGSEGTLGIIISAKIKILPLPKKKILFILSYRNLKCAVIDSAKIVKLAPSALELIDKNIIEHIKFDFPAKTGCLLFVEFDSDIEKSRANLGKIITDAKIIKTLTKKDEVKKWWGIRNSALGFSLRSITPNQSLPTLIEDATVSVEKLVLLVDIIKKISKKYKLYIVTYGHAGNGNLHIRPIIRYKNKKLMKKIAIEFFSKVIEIGGSITGEHGDGLARSEFVKLQYGSDVYSVFKKIKQEFDPKNILNPDKIITTKSSMTENLKI